MVKKLIVQKKNSKKRDLGEGGRKREIWVKEGKKRDLGEGGKKTEEKKKNVWAKEENIWAKEENLGGTRKESFG